MKKILILIIPFMLNAQSYEDKFYKDKTHHPSKIALHSDLGYSSYMIELHSSEIDSAIDYDILEATLGISYSYDDWMWGGYSRFVIDEIRSNMRVTTTNQRLGDQATIDKDEYAIYTNYTIKENDGKAWRVNGIYRYRLLDAQKSYHSYYNYTGLFKYKTQDLALSLVYSQMLDRDNYWSLNGGLVYSRAKVEMSESINANPQDSFVDDSSTALGAKLSLGYQHRISPHLFFTFRADYWQSNFKKMKVNSRVGDTLSKATLKEQTYSLHSGLVLSF